MPEIGTSGLMSGDVETGRRAVRQYPRPSSTLPAALAIIRGRVRFLTVAALLHLVRVTRLRTCAPVLQSRDRQGL